jgi:hypothetical protein
MGEPLAALRTTKRCVIHGTHCTANLILRGEAIDRNARKPRFPQGLDHDRAGGYWYPHEAVEYI